MTAKPLRYEHPEPVPPPSQLVALPFVSSVAGYLDVTVGCSSVRVTIHRVMTRDGHAYLQQICSYAGGDLDHSRAGRLFVVDEGIIGAAFSGRTIMRTRRYGDEAEWWTDYRADRIAVGDKRPAPAEPISYLAVPFLDATGDAVVCVMYAEAGGLNRFVEAGGHLDAVLGMSAGYCRMLDGMSDRPLPRVRNYPLPAGRPVGGPSTLYPNLQEPVRDRKPPRLTRLTSFNFALSA